MNKLNNIKRGLIAIIMCLSLSLYGCGSNNQTEKSKGTSSVEVVIDYGDEESIESALNEGKNLEGKVVRFVAGELNPESTFGYNIMSGEHLNFVSSSNPDVKKNDIMTVKITKIENVMGSWVINYEKVDNAVEGKDTITNDKAKETTSANTTEKTQSTTTAQKSEKTNAETSVSDKSSEQKSENKYQHNEYYDIVETARYKDSIDNTIIIHKVLAKKNVSVSSTLLAYGADGNIIGKSSDDITLTEGQYNFFYYSFESDISNAKFQANANVNKDSFMTGERNAVEMVKYNKSGDELYITLKQNVEKLDDLAKFKVLFYKGKKIVNAENCYFDAYAENLNGKGSTDVAEIWAYDIDYDRIEYIYEP